MIVYIYAVLVIIGGMIGFVKAKSIPSMIAGDVSGVVLFFAGHAIATGKHWGLLLTMAAIALLFLVFGFRYWRSAARAFMPSGLMVIVSFLAFVAVVIKGRGL